MKIIISVLLLALTLSLTACNGGGGNRPPSGNPGNSDNEGQGKEEDGQTPAPNESRECAAEVLSHCQLFGLSDKELTNIRNNVIFTATPDMTPENYPGMKLVIARVLVLRDFIRTYYPHADLELKEENEIYYVTYFESIKWK